jgi:hypothetical protein
VALDLFPGASLCQLLRLSIMNVLRILRAKLLSSLFLPFAQRNIDAARVRI